MKVPTFRVKPTEDAERKTLADIPEWTLAECDFERLSSVVRFRIGDFAYSVDYVGDSPIKQSPAKEYVVRKTIGQIVHG